MSLLLSVSGRNEVRKECPRGCCQGSGILQPEKLWPKPEAGVCACLEDGAMQAMRETQGVDDEPRYWCECYSFALPLQSMAGGGHWVDHNIGGPQARRRAWPIG